MTRLARALQQTGGFDRALALWREVLAIQSRKPPPVRADRARTQAGLARCLLQMGRSAETEPLLSEALHILEKDQPDAWSTFHTKSLLGASLAAQRKLAAAEPLLLAAGEGLLQRQASIPYPDKVYLTDAFARVVTFYNATGKPELAVRWGQRLTAAKLRPDHPRP
jgi:non-specific serine/threonine protein kinase/serine/threonine-protein kinase